MKTQLENKSTENNKLSEEVMKVTEEMARTKGSHPARQVEISGPQASHLQLRSTTDASIL